MSREGGRDGGRRRMSAHGSFLGAGRWCARRAPSICSLLDGGEFLRCGNTVTRVIAEDVRDASSSSACSSSFSSFSSFSSLASSNSSQAVFAPELKAAHRRRALCWERSDPLQTEVASRLCDRLFDIKRDFARVLVLGGAAHAVVRELAAWRREHGRTEELQAGNVGSSSEFHVIHCDVDESVLESCAALGTSLGIRVTSHLVEDLEQEGASIGPTGGEPVDLAIACLGLHWQNNLPLVLSKIRKALKADGLFLGSLFGGDTLHEMRVSCMIAESEREAGFDTQRVSPMALVRDAGSLLSAAGYTLPAVDVDTITMQYATPFDAVQHVRAMAESSAPFRGGRRVRLESAIATAAIYQSLFHNDTETAVSATYQIINLAGWSPHASQQQPAKRGSATRSFADIEHLNAKQSASAPNPLGPRTAGPISNEAPPKFESLEDLARRIDEEDARKRRT